MSSLPKALDLYFRDLSRSNPEMYGDSRALPKPGKTGHPEEFYARCAEQYIDATTTFGRGYMARLLEREPGAKRSTLLRNVKRAEELGLLVRETTPGKVGRASLTPRARMLLDGKERQ